MKITCLHRAIMSRDDITVEEADNLIKEMRNRVISGEFPEDILHNEGFEPDYVFDLLY